MKNSEKEKEKQMDMVPDRYGIMREKIPPKPVPLCKYHYFAKEDDFVEVTVKKTGKVLKRCKFCEREKYENKKIQKEDWKREKENLTDYYVRRTLVRGTKNALPMREYPDMLVEAKRAVIKLKRVNDKLKEGLKKCNKHGKLFRDDVIKNGKRKNGDIVWKCKRCMKEMHAKHYELNRAKVLAQHAKYRKENKEKVAVQKRKSRLKNQMKYITSNQMADAYFRHKYEKDRKSKKYRDQLAVERLTDGYVRRKLRADSSLKNENITQSLIEAKRAILLLKRGIRKKKDEEIFNYLEGKKNHV